MPIMKLLWRVVLVFGLWSLAAARIQASESDYSPDPAAPRHVCVQSFQAFQGCHMVQPMSERVVFEVVEPSFPGTGTAEPAFVAMLFSDGNRTAWFIPAGARKIVRYDVLLKTTTLEITAGPVGDEELRFHGAVFDGVRDIYLIPHGVRPYGILKIDTATGKLEIAVPRAVFPNTGSTVEYLSGYYDNATAILWLSPRTADKIAAVQVASGSVSFVSPRDRAGGGASLEV